MDATPFLFLPEHRDIEEGDTKQSPPTGCTCPGATSDAAVVNSQPATHTNLVVDPGWCQSVPRILGEPHLNATYEELSDSKFAPGVHGSWQAKDANVPRFLTKCMPASIVKLLKSSPMFAPCYTSIPEREALPMDNLKACLPHLLHHGSSCCDDSMPQLFQLLANELTATVHVKVTAPKLRPRCKSSSRKSESRNQRRSSADACCRASATAYYLGGQLFCRSLSSEGTLGSMTAAIQTISSLTCNPQGVHQQLVL